MIKLDSKQNLDQIWFSMSFVSCYKEMGPLIGPRYMLILHYEEKLRGVTWFQYPGKRRDDVTPECAR